MNTTIPTVPVMSASETADFMENQADTLVFCEQNEYARFGTNTDRQWGGTGGMESCSGCFLWNRDTHESYVFHTHYGTNWQKTKELFAELCREGNWEITPASGRGNGAWQKLEVIAAELEQETSGRITQQPTAHVDADKTKFEAIKNTPDQNQIPHTSYMQNSETGKVVAFDEEKLGQYWGAEKYVHVFGSNPKRAFTNGFQYITREGTVPVCSFDGENHTNAPPQLEDTAQMREIEQKIDQIFIDAVVSTGKERLDAIAACERPAERQAAIIAMRNDLFQPVQDYVVAEVAKPEADILNPNIYRIGGEFQARQLWRGLYFNFAEYAEKAIAQQEKQQVQDVEVCPKIHAAFALYKNTPDVTSAVVPYAEGAEPGLQVEDNILDR